MTNIRTAPAPRVDASRPRFSLSLLNHASILLEDDAGTSLLADPWYFGHAFDDGWGLRYRNDRAFEHAQRATHLWISHFHEDHMHMPTLKELFKLNPGIIFLANDSYNFKLSAVARRIGFQNVVELPERRALRLADGFSVTRYPATGIDNMLLVDIAGYKILNYNDCNLSAFAQRQLARKLGKIDMLLSNFNHAGKLLHTSKIPDDVVKRKLRDNFSSNYVHFAPSVVIPFASYHYYRAPESAAQNSSMIDVADLLAIDERIVDLEIGDTLRYEGGAGHRLERGSKASAAITTIDRQDSRSVEQLLEAGRSYAGKLRSGFGVLTHLLPAVAIEITDLGIIGRFRPAVGLAMLDRGHGAVVQLSCHSSALYNWFTKPYGTDAFAVGAHFHLRSDSRFRLASLIAAGMLVENKLDLKSLVLGLYRRDGRQFILNRREEILGILFSGKIFADYHKE